jgi:hypothetical protein
MLTPDCVGFFMGEMDNLCSAVVCETVDGIINLVQRKNVAF